MGWKRAVRPVALIGALIACVSVAALAEANDVVFPDGDYATNSPNLAFGGGGRACGDLGSPVSGVLRVSYNGGANADHFLAGEPLSVTLTPSNPKITASVEDSAPSVPATWGSSQSDEFSIPIDTTLDPSIADGTYSVDVLVHGDISGYNAGDGPMSPGRPKYIVSVSCSPVAPVNHAPSVAVTTNPVSVDEHTTASDSGTYTDADGDQVSLTASYGSVTDNHDGTWSWSATPDDGPSDSRMVTITATDSHSASGSASFQLTVANVPPTVTSLTSNTTQVLVGSPVTFTGSATDPSTADTTAGFSWSFNSGAFGANSFTTSFSTCGLNTVSARAQDKDLGISAPFTSTAVSAYSGHYLPPLTEGIYNAVQKGQVVPVKINVSCNGTNLTGLTPKIQLLSGDIDPATDPGDSTLNVTTASVSNADTTGQMRAIDGGYIYNLAVPSASAGTMFTVRVQPFGNATGGAMYVVIKIRK
jgi:hypothetical protein